MGIGNASSNALEGAIQHMVETGSTIRAHGWPGFSSLTKLRDTHDQNSNHNVKKEDAIEQVQLVAALLKRWLVGTLHGGISHKNLSYYMDEFTFRFNRLKSKGKLFYRLIQQALEIDPVPAKITC